MFHRVMYLFISMFFIVPHSYAGSSSSEVTSADEIEWGYLNPLRGKLSPGAADLWGNRTKDRATGMLVRFNKGFASPPHIHNITYRGVVIEGLLHNDDPGAKEMWMPNASFWTQPAGEKHITAANGETNMIYLEIDRGPYLVQPSTEQFDNGERPLNLHSSNIVWLSDKDEQKVEANGVQIVSLWGGASPNDLGGFMLKLPAHFKGEIVTESPEFRAIIIQGIVTYQSVDSFLEKNLNAGSYFGSEETFKHMITVSNKESILYLRSTSQFRVK